MSDGYKNGTFGLGLITGLGITLNLFLWVGQSNQRKSYGAADTHKADNNGEISSGLDWFFSTFISPSDSLAQWIMTAFTIIAALLLWRTLVSANEASQAATTAALAAVESNKIMRDEQRPWIDFKVKGVEWVITEKTILLKISIEFENIGKNPAFDLNFAARQTQDHIEIEKIHSIFKEKSLDANSYRSVALPNMKSNQTILLPIKKDELRRFDTGEFHNIYAFISARYSNLERKGIYRSTKGINIFDVAFGSSGYSSIPGVTFIRTEAEHMATEVFTSFAEIVGREEYI